MYAVFLNCRELQLNIIIKLYIFLRRGRRALKVERCGLERKTQSLTS